MKTLKLVMVIASASLLVPWFLTACGKQAEPPKEEAEVSAEDVKKESLEALETAKAYTLQQKQEYQNKIEAKLDEVDAQIDELKARAEQAKDETKAKLYKQIEELQKKQEAAREKLEELKTASEQAWEKLKSEMDAAVEDLENFIKDLIPPFE
ncbi:MAG: hypothetical protein JSV16_12690 [Candidatus Hydrogenedentota bacterium]|nr:MAG: hypothetical protein JSV16_12690 [Candidatus Hydrogenedentota bacterium]